MGEAAASSTADDDTSSQVEWPHPVPERRVAPLPKDERSEQTDELLRTLRGRFVGDDEPDMNLFATLAHHPRLLKRWSAFGGTLLFRGELPARDRELLILRTAWNCRAHYEWAHHVPIAHQAGLTDAEITQAGEGPGAAGLAADDAQLLQAADELHADNRIGDATWSALAQRYSRAQLVELCMLVGQYHLVAYAVNSLGIQNEDDEGE